jgi:hypothetical protein
MFVEIIEAGGAALQVIQHRKTILGALRRFRRLVFRGRLRIPVFGDGGTGKTTLGKFLAGELDTSIALPAYRESIVSESRSLPGEIPCVFLIAPGQKRKRPATWPDFYRLLAGGMARGVINVVAYGYHATELEQTRHQVYRKGMTNAEFADAFLAYNREQEIVALRELAPHLQAAQGKIWMVTLVMKQDLWWPNRAAVSAHYMRGEYGDLVKGVSNFKGAENFIHHYYSASLIPENLKTKDAVLVASTASGFDQPLRTANLHNFVQGLNDLIT